MSPTVYNNSNGPDLQRPEKRKRFGYNNQSKEVPNLFSLSTNLRFSFSPVFTNQSQDDVMDCTAYNIPHWNTFYCATLQIHPMALCMLIKCFLLLGCLTFPLKTTKTLYLCIMYKIIALFFYNLQLLNKFTSTAIVHLFKHLQWLSSALYTVFGSRISSFYGNVPAAVCMHHTGLQSLLCISNCILSHSIYVSWLGHTTQESLQITWEDD